MLTFKSRTIPRVPDRYNKGSYEYNYRPELTGIESFRVLDLNAIPLKDCLLNPTYRVRQSDFFKSILKLHYGVGAIDGLDTVIPHENPEQLLEILNVAIANEWNNYWLDKNAKQKDRLDAIIIVCTAKTCPELATFANQLLSSIDKEQLLKDILEFREDNNFWEICFSLVSEENPFKEINDLLIEYSENKFPCSSDFTWVIEDSARLSEASFKIVADNILSRRTNTFFRDIAELRRELTSPDSKWSSKDELLSEHQASQDRFEQSMTESAFITSRSAKRWAKIPLINNFLNDISAIQSRDLDAIKNINPKRLSEIKAYALKFEPEILVTALDLIEMSEEELLPLSLALKLNGKDELSSYLLHQNPIALKRFKMFLPIKNESIDIDTHIGAFHPLFVLENSDTMPALAVKASKIRINTLFNYLTTEINKDIDTSFSTGVREKFLALDSSRTAIANVQSLMRDLFESSLLTSNGKNFCETVRDLANPYRDKQHLLDRLGEESIKLLQIKEDGFLLTEEKVEKALLDFSYRMNLSSDVISHFSSLYKKMFKRALRIHQLINKYKDPKLLFEYAFGFEPLGEVQIIQSPWCLSFRCHNEDDYIRVVRKANPLSSLTETLKTQAVYFPDRQTSRKMEAGLFAIHRVPKFKSDPHFSSFREEHRKYQNWLNENDYPNWVRNAFIHENEHAYLENFIRDGSFDAGLQVSATAFIESVSSINSIDELKNSLRAGLAHLSRRHLERIIKNEILAFKSSGKSTKETKLSLSDHYTEQLLKSIPDIPLHPDSSYISDALWQPLKYEAVSATVNKTIEQVLSAYDLLCEFYRDKAFISELLTTVPLHSWPELALNLKPVIIQFELT